MALPEMDSFFPAQTIQSPKGEVNLDGILDCSSILFSSNKSLSSLDPGNAFMISENSCSQSGKSLTPDRESDHSVSSNSPLDSVANIDACLSSSPSKTLVRSQSADCLDIPCYSGRRIDEDVTIKTLYSQTFLSHKCDFWATGPPNLPFPFNREMAVGPMKSSPLSKSQSGSSQKPPKPPRRPKPVKPANIFIVGQEGLSPRHQVRKLKLEVQNRELSKQVFQPRAKTKQGKKGKLMTFIMGILLSLLFLVLVLFQGWKLFFFFFWVSIGCLS